MKLSVIIPVYNEKDCILLLLDKVRATPYPKEIIIVDDCSQDGTREILKGIKEDGIRVLYHSHNQGKGAAIRTGLEQVTGDIVLFQDADLEYDPKDFRSLIEPIVEGKAEAVFGSRFQKNNNWKYRKLYWANKLFTFLTNLLYGASLSDMGAGYKAFRVDVLKSIKIVSNHFDIDPELAAKMLKGKRKLIEVPISYRGRAYEEGKKIHWQDGFRVINTLIKFRFVS